MSVRSARTLTFIILLFSLLLVSRPTEAATLGLAWDPAGDGVTTGYIVRYGTSPGTYTESIDVGMVTSFTLNNLNDGVTYYFVVQGYDEHGVTGPFSNEASGLTPPAAPRNLAATVAGGTVNLVWQAVSGTITGYRVEVGTSSGTSNVATIDAGTQPAFAISNLSPGTYYIRVRSVNGTGPSGPSNEVIAVVAGASAPTPPTSLVASVRSNQYIDLAWGAASGTVTGYRVEVGTSSGSSNVMTATIGAVTSHTLSGLSAGTYYIRVRAFNSAGTSAASNQVTATIQNPDPLPPLSVTATVRQNRYVDVSWTRPSGPVSSYRVRVGRTPGASDVLTINTAATNYTITLSPGRYYLRVHTIYNSRLSAPSEEVTVNVGNTAPSRPGNLTVQMQGGTVALLTWQAAAGAASYRVEVGSAPGASNVRSETVSTNSYTLTGLTGGPYYARVRGLSGSLTSDATNEVQILFVPGTPTGVSAAVRSKRYIDVTWTPTPGATSYAVSGGTASRWYNVGTKTSTTTKATFILSPGTYYFIVRAVNDAGSSAASVEVRVEIPRSAPPPPTNLTGTVREGNLIDLAWDPASEDVTFYRVEVGTGPGQTDVSSFTTGVTSSFTIGELPSRTYYVRVRAANDEGYSEPSEELALSGVGGATAPRRLSAITNARRQVRVTWDPPEDATGVIGYQIEAGTGPGRSDLAVARTTGTSFVAAAVPPGAYFVRVRTITAAGLGSSSNEAIVQVGGAQQCTAPPTAPKFWAEVRGSYVQLSWAPGVGDAPTGYLLDVGTQPGRRDILSAPLGSDVTTLTTPAANGTYAMRLTAVNACGRSAWGSDATVTVGGPELALPGAPSGLTAQVEGRAATLSWAPPVDGGPASSFLIEVLAENGQTLLSLNTGNVSTVFGHGNVPPGRYLVRVRAINARGAGEASNTVLVVVE